VRAVIDANLVAAMVLPLPYSDQATQRLTIWEQAGVELLAPLLLEYEVVAVLRRAVVGEWLTTDLAVQAIKEILALDIRCVAPTLTLHERALLWAERLGHGTSYDAHYLALAEQEGVELWTADRRLANGAQRAGAHWVHWVGEAIAAD
jgi:predicted nucleic acid-binding protein